MLTKYKYGKGWKIYFDFQVIFQVRKSFETKTLSRSQNKNGLFQASNFGCRRPQKFAFSFLHTPRHRTREFICLLQHTRGMCFMLFRDSFQRFPSAAGVHHFFPSASAILNFLILICVFMNSN
jgi:hypothetical protein